MKNQITYTEHNGLYYPDLALPEQTNYALGKYANLRLDFMKKHRRGTYTTLLTEGRFNEHLQSHHHEDLEKSFTDEQKEIFEKFHDCWSEYMSLGEAAIFEYAFKLRMQIAIETLTE